MDDLQQMKNVLSENLGTLHNTYSVEKIGIFGSYATKQNTQESDVDLLVEFSEPIGMLQFAKLVEYLEGLAGKKVDLVTKNALKPTIREDVLRDLTYV